MTMEPSPEYVKRQLQSADEALSDARYLLVGSRLKAAANRAYYAMFYAIQAALAVAKVRRPRTHSGAINLFGRYYIRTGKMDRSLAKDLQDAYNLRQQSDYEVLAVIGEEPVRGVVEKAEAFVAEVKKALNLEPSESGG